ncbi:Rrp15p-domain-containing protein [Delphinella strobiligena]|nr:Rrp15p-domain-containing protein [Delphinella strobiligena]
MGNPSAKRRRPEEGYRKPAKKIKNFKKQKSYHSDSESEFGDDVQDNASDFKPISMDESDDEGEGKTPAPKKPTADASESEEDDDDDDDMVENLDDLEDEDDDDEPDLDDSDMSDAGSDAISTGANSTKLRKRNDPAAFATSLSKILSSKLSTSKRSDPVLSRSVDAASASRELTDARLEAKAKRQIHAEKRAALEKGRVKDVLGLETTDVSTAHIQESERRLKKTAQRGVIKLFNAVRAAQVKGEQARAEARHEGVVGLSQREERASEMSKQGFLDLLAKGGKKAPAMNVQEA